MKAQVIGKNNYLLSEFVPVKLQPIKVEGTHPYDCLMPQSCGRFACVCKRCRSLA